MLPSVRELLAFRDYNIEGQPLPSVSTDTSRRAAQPTSVTRQKSSSPEDSAPFGMRTIGPKQRPGRKAGSGDRYSASSIARQYRCGVHNCAALFKRPEHLKRHMLTHTQVRPFRCDARGCGKRFSRRDNYATHARKHESADAASTEHHCTSWPSQSPRLSPSSVSSRYAASDTAELSEDGSAIGVGSHTPQPPSAISSIFGLLNQDAPSTAAWADACGVDSQNTEPHSHDVEETPVASASAEPQSLRSLDLLAYATVHVNATSSSELQQQQLLQPSQRASVGPATPATAVEKAPPVTTVAMTASTAGDPSKPFMCSMCDSRFGRLEHVKRHQLVHTGERQFECPTCNKSFARKDNMVQHLRAHQRKSNSAIASA
ncbi:hypothetical protein H4R20_002448 [Coemansia guatemalensis]|uniref:C2H2-type domain-containing protein n=1 Tax=Coemansia guatemalensis TaxID=2761395 RepID=A0A9W8LV06_9FUNG|nr:hypothetical protein H4R20_002448 [Coemansia guatemalensis]